MEGREHTRRQGSLCNRALRVLSLGSISVPAALVRPVLLVLLLAACQDAMAQTATRPQGLADPPAASVATPDAPPESVQAQYRDVVARAVAEFDGGRWAEARSLFLQAHALWPSARTLRTLGMTSFELRNYARALEELETSLRDERRPLPDDQRRQV